MTHTLRIWPQYFEDVQTGDKTFEVRRNDRGYQLGDVLELQEFDPHTNSYTRREQLVLVTYITDLGPVGIPGWVAMGIMRKPIEARP